MTSKLMPDRIDDDVDVIDAWKIRRDMKLEEQMREEVVMQDDQGGAKAYC
jgi:hypothetical protein